jgi:hypothetical protein
MFRVAFNDPRLLLWQRRLQRIPRWGWLIIGIAIFLPVAIMLAGIALVALIFGVIALALVAAAIFIRNLWRRITSRNHRQPTTLIVTRIR